MVFDAMPSIWWPEILISFVRNRTNELILDFDSAFSVLSGSSLQFSYCECFHAGVFYSEPCSCQGCLNKPSNMEIVRAFHFHLMHSIRVFHVTIKFTQCSKKPSVYICSIYNLSSLAARYLFG
ncbi:hypothetical protein ACQJBY_047968 [Aegilops geniculata]